MPVPRSIRLLAALAAMLALSSCSKSGLEAPSAAAKEPVFESAGPQSDGSPATATGPLSGSKDIDGAVGGKLLVGSYRVEVPPGAYKGVATITIVQDDRNVLKCDLSISPASANQFSVPVTLAVKLPNSLALAVDQNMWLDPSAGLWRLIPSVPDPLTTELCSPLWHFSQYATGRAGW